MTTTLNGAVLDDLDALLDGNFKTAGNIKTFSSAIDSEQPPVAMFKFQPLSLTDLLTMPPKQWIINQVLGSGDVAMIYGGPGSGKTFIIIDLLYAACLGRQWAMRFDIPRPLNVAYCAGEGVSGLRDRFAAAAEHYGVTALPNLTVFAVTPSLFYEERIKNDIESMDRFIQEWKVRQDAGEAQPLDILVIDTLHSATPGADENSAQDMGVVLGFCKKAARLLGCAVVLVHHTNKNGTGERGSSALRGAMDAMIEVRRISENGTKAVMSCTKLKDGSQWKEQTFDLVAVQNVDSVRVWWDEPNDDVSGDRRKTNTEPRILELLAQADISMTAKQISEPLAAKPQSVNTVLDRLREEGKIVRDVNARGVAIYSITDTGREALQPIKRPTPVLNY